MAEYLQLYTGKKVGSGGGGAQKKPTNIIQTITNTKQGRFLYVKFKEDSKFKFYNGVYAFGSKTFNDEKYNASTQNGVVTTTSLPGNVYRGYIEFKDSKSKTVPVYFYDNNQWYETTTARAPPLDPQPEFKLLTNRGDAENKAKEITSTKPPASPPPTPTPTPPEQTPENPTGNEGNVDKPIPKFDELIKRNENNKTVAPVISLDTIMDPNNGFFVQTKANKKNSKNKFVYDYFNNAGEAETTMKKLADGVANYARDKAKEQIDKINPHEKANKEKIGFTKDAVIIHYYSYLLYKLQGNEDYEDIIPKINFSLTEKDIENLEIKPTSTEFRFV
jgi:hypothetical protein